MAGINTAIISKTGANVGIGFAVPINMAKLVMEQLIATGEMDQASIDALNPALTNEASAGKVPLPHGISLRVPKGKAEISRKEFGLVWNVALETGGVLVSDTIKLEMDVEAVKKQ